METKVNILDILEIVEFDYTINENGHLKLIDNLGANLCGIEDKEFTIDELLSVRLINELERYINDYIIEDIIDRLRSKYNEDMDNIWRYKDIIQKMNNHYEEFEYDINILKALDNPLQLIDITDIKKNIIKDKEELNNMSIEYSINKYSNNRFEIELNNAMDRYIIDDLIDNMKIIQESYISKYNKYVVYDFAPACIDGFKYSAQLEVSERYIDFMIYLITTRINNINKLEGCLQLEYVTEGVN